MKTNYKIFILPLIIFLFAIGSVIIDKPFELNKTTFSENIPLPFKQIPKTEWTKPKWSNEIIKSFSKYFVSLPILNIDRPKTFSFIITDDVFYYSLVYLQNHNNRAPPFFS